MTPHRKALENEGEKSARSKRTKGGGEGSRVHRQKRHRMIAANGRDRFISVSSRRIVLAKKGQKRV